MPTIRVKKLREDPGNCRVYYRGEENKHLYCKQEDAPGKFVWYRCTTDGEPWYPLRNVNFEEE